MFNWLRRPKQVRWADRQMDDDHVDITGSDWLKRLPTHEERTHRELQDSQRPSIQLPPKPA